ncbi:MAG: hypothetical protein K0S79_1937 [Nitrospira sp.]|nr:hypothetical protein [Nitrospira sp.]
MPEISLKGLVEGLKNLADLGVRLSRFYRCASRRRFVPAKVADCFSGSLKPLQILQESDSAMGCHRLFADTVLFDLVLKGTETDTKQFGRLLAVVGDFGEGPPDRVTFDFL